MSHTIRAIDRLTQQQTFALNDFSLGLIDGRLDGLNLHCSVGHKVVSPYCSQALEEAVAAQSRKFGAIFNYYEAPLMYDRAFLATFPARAWDIATPSRNPNLFVFQIRNPFDQVISAAKALQNFRRNPGMVRMEALIDFAWRMHKAWVIQVVEAATLLDFPFVFVNYDRLVANPEKGFPEILRLVVKPDVADLVGQNISGALELTSTDRVKEFERSSGRALANDQRADDTGKIKSHVGNVASGKGRELVPDEIRRDIELFYSDPRYSKVFDDGPIDVL